MTEAESRILRNQVEIMGTLKYLLECARPELIGHGGWVDALRSDLYLAGVDTKNFLDRQRSQPQ